MARRARIFVNYRRDDTADMAGRLADRLRTRWWRVAKVFIDVDEIHTGKDFREEITRALQSCDVLFALIGPNWLTATDEKGVRRLDDPDDVLVFEIRTALDRGVPVVPVRVGDATVPARSDLPDSIAELRRRQAGRLRNDSFRDDVASLLAGVPPERDGGRRTAPHTGPLSALAGLLLVFAALRFALLARPLTGPDQVADAVATTAVAAVGLALLLTPVRRGAAWAAAAGVFLGVVPFVAVRMWWSAQVRQAVPPLVLESPIWMILAALGIVLFLVASREGFERPRLAGNASLAAGVAVAVGLVAAGFLLPATDDELATLRLSDPILLLASAGLAVLALATRGVLQGAVLAGWAAGLCGVAANTVWLLRHTEFGIPVRILGTHLALSFLAVVVVVVTVAVRLRADPPDSPTPGTPS